MKLKILTGALALLLTGSVLTAFLHKQHHQKQNPMTI